jgi:hypothetical protein
LTGNILECSRISSLDEQLVELASGLLLGLVQEYVVFLGVLVVIYQGVNARHFSIYNIVAGGFLLLLLVLLLENIVTGCVKCDITRHGVCRGYQLLSIVTVHADVVGVTWWLWCNYFKL